MKKFLKVLSVALFSAAILTSCSSDDGGKKEEPTSTFVLDANNFKGTIGDGEVVLESGQVYKLTGKLVVENFYYPQAGFNIMGGITLKF